METLLQQVARHIALAIQAVAVLVVAIGAVRAVIDMARVALASGGREQQRRAWVDYARWQVAGLTFELAADVVDSRSRRRGTRSASSRPSRGFARS